MACITMEGTLWIELADMYTWLENSGVRTEGATGIQFLIESDSLQLRFAGARVIDIDAADFWTWVINTQLPAGLPHYETLFGVPRQDGQYLVVTFAFGNETHPKNWGKPPACLAEWVRPVTKTADTILQPTKDLESVTLGHAAGMADMDN